MACTELEVTYDLVLDGELPVPDSYAAHDPVDLMVSRQLDVRTWRNRIIVIEIIEWCKVVICTQNVSHVWDNYSQRC